MIISYYLMIIIRIKDVNNWHQAKFHNFMYHSSKRFDIKIDAELNFIMIHNEI